MFQISERDEGVRLQGGGAPPCVAKWSAPWTVSLHIQAFNSQKLHREPQQDTPGKGLAPYPMAPLGQAQRTLPSAFLWPPVPSPWERSLLTAVATA